MKTMKSFFQPFHSTVCILSFSVYFMCGLWKQIHSCSDHKKNKKIQEIKIHGIFVCVLNFPSESVLWKQIQRCSDQKRNNKILKFHENHEILFSTFSFNGVFTNLQSIFHVQHVETTTEVLRSQKEQKIQEIKIHGISIYVSTFVLTKLQRIFHVRPAELTRLHADLKITFLDDKIYVFSKLHFQMTKFTFSQDYISR